MTKRSKSNNLGITLIALVVTIIVLMILAGIAVAALMGDNGIIKRAGEAKESQRGATVQDEVTLAISENKMTDEINKTKGVTGGLKTKETLVNELVGKGYLTNDEATELETEDEITIGSITVDFSVLGSSSTEKTLVQAFKDGEINVGDYITNYNSTLKNSSASVTVSEVKTGYSGTQQYQVDTNTTWRVLGLDETETKLMITTGSPIKKVMKSTGEDWEKDPYLYLDSAEGWYWAGEMTSGNVLDEICAIYDSRFADSTKSMRIEDINTALGLTLDRTNNKIYKTSDQSKTAISAYEGYFGQSYTYTTNDYAPENYLKAKYPSNSAYTSMTNKRSGDSVVGTTYMYQYTSSDIVDQNSKLYEVLFSGTESGSSGKSYWLASSGVYLFGSSSCCFGPGAVIEGYAGTGLYMFDSYGFSTAIWLAVRPVVYLQSGVTVEDLTTTSSGSEENWIITVPNSYLGKSLNYGRITE